MTAANDGRDIAEVRAEMTQLLGELARLSPVHRRVVARVQAAQAAREPYVLADLFAAEQAAADRERQARQRVSMAAARRFVKAVQAEPTPVRAWWEAGGTVAALQQLACTHYDVDLDDEAARMLLERHDDAAPLALEHRLEAERQVLPGGRYLDEAEREQLREAIRTWLAVDDRSKSALAAAAGVHRQVVNRALGSGRLEQRSAEPLRAAVTPSTPSPSSVNL